MIMEHVDVNYIIIFISNLLFLKSYLGTIFKDFLLKIFIIEKIVKLIKY